MSNHLPWIGVAALLGFCLTPTLSAANTRWEGRWYSKLLYENTQKEYNIQTDDFNTGLTLITPATDRVDYFSTYLDLYFKMSNDLSTKAALDISDSLKAQYYNLEDYDAIDEDSYKYRYVNNVFLTTWGYSLSPTKSLKLDVENTYYRLPVVNSLDNSTTRGNFSFTNNFSKNFSTTLAVEGKVGRYPNATVDDFDEGSLYLNLYHYFPEVVKNIEVIPAGRFDADNLMRGASGLNYELVYDYNSKYSVNRDYPTAPEVYRTELVRGDFYLNLDMDWDNRRLVNSTSESYVLGTYSVTGGYNINDGSSVRITDTYTDINYQSESDFLFNYNYFSNKLNIGYSAKVSDFFNFNINFDTSYFKYPNFPAQEYTLRTSSIDFDYHPNRLNYYLSLVATDQDYMQERDYYPSSFKTYATFILSYKLTDALKFKFRDDYSKLDYGRFQNSVYSTNHQNIYTLGVEWVPHKHHILEFGFYALKERNNDFFVNDVTERTLQLNWQWNF